MTSLYNYILTLATVLALAGPAPRAAAEGEDAGMLGIVLAEKKVESPKIGDPKQATVFARSVLPGSAADLAGVKTDDVIVEFNGQPLPTVVSLQSLAAKTKPGTKINLSILRDGKSTTLAVVMGSRKEFEQTTTTSFLGKPAPEFNGIEVKTGKAVKLSDFANRPVLIEMWATWCPTCRANIPRLNAMTERYKDKKLQIIAISNEELDVVKNFEQKIDVKYLSIRAEEGGMHRAYWTNAIPTLIYVDAKGLIKQVSVGLEGLDAIEREISSLK
jgi:thiol-disulfide isomerase/thioredoxin